MARASGAAIPRIGRLSADYLRRNEIADHVDRRAAHVEKADRLPRIRPMPSTGTPIIAARISAITGSEPARHARRADAAEDADEQHHRGLIARASRHAEKLRQEQHGHALEQRGAVLVRGRAERSARSALMRGAAMPSPAPRPRAAKSAAWRCSTCGREGHQHRLLECRGRSGQGDLRAEQRARSEPEYTTNMVQRQREQHHAARTCAPSSFSSTIPAELRRRD
jgi:hypothetical protein